MTTRYLFCGACGVTIMCLCAWANAAFAQGLRHEFVQADPGFGKTHIVAVPLERAAPFLALGAQWQAASASPLEIRTSTDGLTWSEWLTLAHDHDPRALAALVLSKATVLAISAAVVALWLAFHLRSG